MLLLLLLSLSGTQAGTMQSTFDQPCQLANRPLASSARSRLVPASRPRRTFQHTSNPWRAVPCAFNGICSPALSAWTRQRARTHVLRCTAAKLDQYSDSDRKSLQLQVDRLTSLVNTLQVATTWHDKVGSTLYCQRMVSSLVVM